MNPVAAMALEQAPLEQRALEQMRHGDYAAALEALQQLEQGYRESGAQAALGRIQAYQAESYLSMGKSHLGLMAARDAAASAAQTGDARLLAAVQLLIFDLYSQLGNTQQALDAVEQAKRIASELGDRQLEAAALNGLGRIHTLRGDSEQAIRDYVESARLAESSGATSLYLTAEINRVQLLAGNADLRGVSSAAAGLARKLAGLDDAMPKANGYLALGRALYLAGAADGHAPDREWLAQARSLLHKGREVAERIGNQALLSYYHGYLADLELLMGERSAALASLQRAIFYAQLNSDQADPLYRWKLREGRLLVGAGNYDQAIVVYRQAVAAVAANKANIRRQHVPGRIDSDYDIEKIFSEYADLLLKRSESVAAEEQRQSYLVEARNTLELLKAGELENYFKDDCVAELQARASGVDNLGEGAAALYPVILQDRVSLLLSLPDGIKQYVVKVDRKRVDSEIINFRRLIEKRTTFEYIRPSKQLHNYFIAPLEQDLQRHNIKTLVVIPGGMLRTIPLAALYDGKRYLVEKYAIATTPGLSLTDPKPLQHSNKELLVGGLTDPVQGFNALPNVRGEVEEITSLFGNRALMNQAFTSKSIRSALDTTPYTIVHIASHAQFRESIDDTFLLTYSDKISMDSLQSLLAVSKFRDNPVELLTLSACQTAVGDEKAALGLAGIAIKSGARSALATLWYINDQASSDLVTDFYAHLSKDEQGKAEALRVAQMRMIKDLRYRHAAYWAPFLIIGNWL